MQGDLTTLAKVKDYLGIKASIDTSDVILSRMITAASKFVLNYIARQTLAPMTVTDIYDGNGKNFLVIRQWPVLSVESINFCGQSITVAAAGNPLTPGYLIDSADASGGAQQLLTLIGYCFPYGRSIVFVRYRYGYMISGEAAVVPPSSPWTLTTDFMWLSDEGVTYADGTALTAVPSNPAQGQYSVAAGTYAFNEADEGQAVLISYGYCPADVEEATIELIAESYRRKERVGEMSKSLGGQETVSFSQKDMHDSIALALQPYCRTAPA